MSPAGRRAASRVAWGRTRQVARLAEQSDVGRVGGDAGRGELHRALEGSGLCSLLQGY